MPKKACILYVNTMLHDATDVGRRLEEEQYEVCLTEISENEGKAAQQGIDSISMEVDACLSDADVKVILIPSDEIPANLAGVAEHATKGSGRLVAVCQAGAALPQAVQERANSVVSPNSNKLTEALLRSDIWEGPNGEKIKERKPARVKCQ